MLGAMSSLSARRLALFGLVAGLVLPGVAHADVVFRAPCPFGSRSTTSHAGPRCAPYACTADSECESGLVCRPWRVCTQTRAVPIAGRGAFRNPPPPPQEEVQVIAACAPTETCDGSEPTRPPAIGAPIGEVACAVATYCVRPDLPPIPPAPPESQPTEEPSEATPAGTSPAVSRPASTGSACGCRVWSSRDSAAPWLFALAMGLVVAVRRWR
jgi:hypothetical protein